MHALVPFQSTSDTAKIKILAEAWKEKETGELCVKFVIEDPTQSIYWSNKERTRLHDLWKATCFEVFFGIAGSEEYWELNLSEAGSWNLYRFDFYRSFKEPREEDRITQIDFSKEIKKSLELRAKIPMAKLGVQSKKLEVSMTSVIEFKNKEKSFFALKHIEDKPNFHKRESFVCNLE